LQNVAFLYYFPMLWFSLPTLSLCMVASNVSIEAILI
jgi:hypothetical protein